MDERPETIAELQRMIDRSAATAGKAIRRNFVGPGWSMSAREFVEFWGGGRMASISTASSQCNVHTTPLDLRLVDGKFYAPTFPDSQRLRDHRARPRCAISSWNGPYTAVIIYGVANEVGHDPTGRTSEAEKEQGYAREAMVTVEITPTRIYAIRPPVGHHSLARN